MNHVKVKNSVSVRKKVCFILPSLQAGGAERVFSTLAKNLNKEVFEGTLIVLGYAKDDAYDVSNCNVVYLNKLRLIKALPSLFRVIKSSEPDLVISSIGHVNLAMGVFAILFKKTKFLGREASVISTMKKYAQKRYPIPKILIRYLYNNLDGIICQSNDMKMDFQKIHKTNESKMFVINNPAPKFFETQKENEVSRPVKFITVGRLSPEKGHLRILNILSKLNLDFTYTIVGTGILQKDIEDYIRSKNLKGNVNFIKFTSEVSKVLSRHDFFLQGSYVEGFPNALLESCAVGTPAIAFNVPGGTKEIIQNGVNGFLVEDENQYLHAIEKAIKMFWETKTVQNSIYEKFSLEKIMKDYESAFCTILKAS